MLSRSQSALAYAALAASFSGCSRLANLPGGANAAAVRPDPPVVSVSSVALVSSPSNTGLAKYFCPTVANSLVCGVLGAAPKAHELKFVFDATLAVENPNTVPLPAAEALVAFTAYPEAASSANVGAVCVSLCPEGEVCGAPPADGCTDDGTLKSMNDYASAAVGFLANVAVGNTKTSDVAVRTIAPGETINATVRLELDPEAVLSLMSQAGGDSLQAIKSGSMPSFSVPFMLEGTVWVQVESFGKIAAGFGPHRDTWTLGE